MSASAKESQPFIVAPGEAELIRPFGIDMQVLIGGERTGGTFSAITAEIKPGEGPCKGHVMPMPGPPDGWTVTRCD